ncbi:hypothetical protein C9374_003648 [Naegleria lovaniensis]|uniref:DUF962 domain-containing protein n=1 Tax=Naegleria lovaniensis TaxID=51637 RepID=A0AA88H098_NAELO|nr:uncharacterized protein C9374_003648 [Naegleria lovaniensis]KAG2393884.1 hypothetical protein C9374_003648 [Naegleria lovaniensis]
MATTTAASTATSTYRYKSFSEFYPFYISQHQNPVCRLLHVIGTFSGACVLGYCISMKKFWLMPTALLIGYGFAWIGHFVFEKNKPATFTYPLWSFMGDWKMMFEVLTFRRGLKD